MQWKKALGLRDVGSDSGCFKLCGLFVSVQWALKISPALGPGSPGPCRT